jgi:DNA mismatch endonuclease (patch repair protein)
MADIFTKEKRSDVMRRIRAKNTKPELLVRQFLFSKGFRYRLHQNTLPGKPDIILKRYKTVIFVNGCFWHGHKSCKKSILPTSNTAFWKEKIQANTDRDKNTKRSLKKLGWSIFTIWECNIKNKKSLNKELNKLLDNLNAIKAKLKY